MILLLYTAFVKCCRSNKQVKTNRKKGTPGSVCNLNDPGSSPNRVPCWTSPPFTRHSGTQQERLEVTNVCSHKWSWGKRTFYFIEKFEFFFIQNHLPLFIVYLWFNLSYSAWFLCSSCVAQMIHGMKPWRSLIRCCCVLVWRTLRNPQLR